jgi:hypothetical protein
MEKNQQNNFNISQEFEIIPHQKGKAYPIGVKEWEFIKKKIGEINIDVNNFHSIGFLLLGASASCLITIFATEFKTDSSLYLTWAIFGISLIGGLLSVYFATDKHKQESAKPNEIINQMELIESRFENHNE